MNNLRTRLEVGLADLNIACSAEQVEKLCALMAILKAWNQRFNLTAIEDIEGMVVKHILDSVAPLRYTRVDSSVRMIDVGSGAGFPGVPLKIMRPEWRVTLVEASRKKSGFLDAVCVDLGLIDIEVVWGRAEELGQEAERREQYQLAVARAVAPLRVLAEYCLPFVEEKGWMWAYKGARVHQEIDEAEEAVRILGGAAPEALQMTIPDLNEERWLVAIEKKERMPLKYPRRPGVPAKKPL